MRLGTKGRAPRFRRRGRSIDQRRRSILNEVGLRVQPVAHLTVISGSPGRRRGHPGRQRAFARRSHGRSDAVMVNLRKRLDGRVGPGVFGPNDGGQLCAHVGTPRLVGRESTREMCPCFVVDDPIGDASVKHIANDRFHPSDLIWIVDPRESILIGWQQRQEGVACEKVKYPTVAVIFTECRRLTVFVGHQRNPGSRDLSG